MITKNADCSICIHARKTTDRCVRLQDGTLLFEQADSESITCGAGTIREMRITETGMFCSSFRERED